MHLNDWFQKGMTYEQYVDSMNVNRDRMLEIYDNVQLSEEDHSFFRQAQTRNWRVIVLTADWCGDAMLCIPILKRIAESAHFDLRMLIRDENLELMDQYLTNGKSRSIPIFIFIDEAGMEKAVWGPRSPYVQQMIEQMRSQLPDNDDPLFEEKQRQMYREFKDRISSDPSIWKTVIDSIRARLTQPLTS
ncbi:thioredoxin family protein [Paenactinomyces guangxiensis]|uniref:Thioredoxin family protein n=1 Tax=Paenactinomyces guangxiensis TaxID=1490290 RepID=A0A7W1WTY4_9BACL|nr:thioredoxin family protein [Paenactinomyces guangxiensis]MBA4496000.1 thioredoxin family protein [Paenactinomyces guangxiensis]MBH8593124.1 thioredoxin family protein [Paenactinomyces guangxiensis]